MTEKEVYDMLRRNNHPKAKAIRYISDFLMISYQEAKLKYEKEFEKGN